MTLMNQQGGGAGGGAKVGSTTIAGTVEYVAGKNTVIDVDQPNKKITLNSNLNTWVAGTSYKTHDVIAYNGAIYRALMDHISASNFTVDYATGVIWELLSGVSSGSGAGINQTTQLGVVANSTAPVIINIPVQYNADFRRLPVEVLKLTPGAQSQVITQYTFDSTNSGYFTSDSQVTFSGTMQLKNLYGSALTSQGTLGSGVEYSQVIDTSTYKNIEKIEVW